MGFKLSKFAGLLVVVSVLITSDAFAVGIVSAGTGGNWSATGTWAGGVVPTAADTVTIAANTTVTIDTAASITGLTVALNGTLLFTSANTLTVSANGFRNYGTFDSTNAGAISSTATSVLGMQAIWNYPSGYFKAGAGPWTLVPQGSAVGFKNEGVFITKGTGLVNLNEVFRNLGMLTVDTGGLSITSFYPDLGSFTTLNGNLTVGGNIIATGASTFSGSGNVILTDANHSITGPVNLWNLQIEPLTLPHTISIAGAVMTTGSTTPTALHGSSTANKITFTDGGAGSFTPSFTSSLCAASALLSITCSSGGGVPTSAPIDLISSGKSSSFSREVQLK